MQVYNTVDIGFTMEPRTPRAAGTPKNLVLRSSAYQHYTIEDKGGLAYKAACKHCPTIMSGTYRTTTNILNHLKVRIWRLKELIGLPWGYMKKSTIQGFNKHFVVKTQHTITIQ